MVLVDESSPGARRVRSRPSWYSTAAGPACAVMPGRDGVTWLITLLQSQAKRHYDHSEAMTLISLNKRSDADAAVAPVRRKCHIHGQDARAKARVAVGGRSRMDKPTLRRISRLLALPACWFMVATSMAHPGHDDALTTVQAIAIAKAAVRGLVKSGELINGETLPESWNEADGRATCSATPIYYLVGLQNYSEGKTLHVLLDHGGRFRRARFDANFAELKFSSFPVFPCERW